MEVTDVIRFEMFDKEVIKKYTAIEYSTKLNVEGLKFAPGGSAANVSVDLTNLEGTKTAYLGKMGNDFMGQECIMDLKKHGVNTDGVIYTDMERTGLAVILITPYGKDRSILAHKGANNLIEPKELNLDLLDRCNSLIWTSLTSKSGINTIQKAITYMKEKNKPIYAAPSISILRNQAKEARKLVEQSELLSLNKEELEALTGQAHVYAGLEEACRMGPKIVAVTNGKDGSYITNGKDVIEAETFEVDVKDTTGAGDAFVAGLIYGSNQGMGMEEMIKFASAFSAFECMVLGVREGFPDKTIEVVNYINSNPLPIKYRKLK